MEELKLNEKFSKTTLKHMVEFLMSAVTKGFKGKISDMTQYSTNHRTTMGKFLNKYNWDTIVLDGIVKAKVIEYIIEKHQAEMKPIFVSIDDTVCCKNKPSSKAKSPIEGTSHHYSHLLGKTVWGHQNIAIMLTCGEITLNFDIHQYDKTQSKIEYIIEMAKQLPKCISSSYALMDSWFPCAEVIEAYEKQGYYCIGGLKKNRIIYPNGTRISIEQYAAEHLTIEDFNLVTVKSKKYYVHRYEGHLNGIPNAVVLISYPADAFKNPKALKAFICTDVSLDTETILTYYAERWCIETFFQQEKNSLGFDKYQMRSIRGIKRFWLLTSLAHLMCCTAEYPAFKPFGEGLRNIRKSVKIDIITYIYNCSQDGVPLSVLIDEFAA
ncbi:transposase [Clostridia bacterium]|nr:transposase [Clostridia bacterium]